MSGVEHSPPIDNVEKNAYADKAAVVSNPDERRRAALAEIDDAKFSWFHAKACIVAGESNFQITVIICFRPPSNHHPSVFFLAYTPCFLLSRLRFLTRMLC